MAYQIGSVSPIFWRISDRSDASCGSDRIEMKPESVGVRERLSLKAIKRYRHSSIAKSWGGGIVGSVIAFLDSLLMRTPAPPQRKNIRALWWAYGNLLPRNAMQFEAIMEVATILYGAKIIETLDPPRLINEALRQRAENVTKAADAWVTSDVSISTVDAAFILLRELDRMLPSYDSFAL